MRDHTFHETQVDFENCRFNKNENYFEKRGCFEDIERKLDLYQKEGVTALYLMGTLERDNYPILNKYTERIEFRKEDASPLAVTTRDTSNSMLGGNEALARLVRRAK